KIPAGIDDGMRIRSSGNGSHQAVRAIRTTAGRNGLLVLGTEVVQLFLS
ncbi:hypothetical protein QWA_17885, partial [Alcaligenes faecalis subsp. faecalis NCIB 8687]